MTDKPKKGLAKAAGRLTGNPKQFRLSDETLADMDYLIGQLGLTTRTDVIRLAVRKLAQEERRKEK